MAGLIAYALIQYHVFMWEPPHIQAEQVKIIYIMEKP